MKQRWKVGELAEMTGLTVRTLQYYDQIGLFSPSGHSESGHRIYTEFDIGELQQIMSLKEIGLSLDEIKSVLSDDRFSLHDIVSLQIAKIEKNLVVQQKLLNELKYVSSLMLRKEPLTVEAFTKLLAMMRLSHEKFFADKQAIMNTHLDRLGALLDEDLTQNQNNGGHNHERTFRKA